MEKSDKRKLPAVRKVQLDAERKFHGLGDDVINEEIVVACSILAEALGQLDLRQAAYGEQHPAAGAMAADAHLGACIGMLRHLATKGSSASMIQMVAADVLKHGIKAETELHESLSKKWRSKLS